MKTQSKLDPRRNKKVEEIVNRLAKVKYIPLVHEADLLELEKVFKSIPEMEYPINSGAELIEKLGGSGKLYTIAEVTVDPVRMIKYMPAYYFPVASAENLIEKLVELIRANRKKVDIPAELMNLRHQTGNLKFPIKSADELYAQLQDKGQYKFQGRAVDAKMMIGRIPERMFPFKSQTDFEHKIIYTMINKPLIVKD
ncbi:hypothetical protein [Flavihumibacter petaseus]|uniref:Uncharacterized protein n=1 Tax=Flavihumibacter petaseus NBRC 106054 TaxID=1220578 RepID=A0A0E9N7S9_9BACT|nr:hypothetical protein [Flavihumibacter petaseus]GAO45410.1 hypothetical protein FPE01S_05_01050 [Flavihumibacter petaseus NBRC 106054]